MRFGSSALTKAVVVAVVGLLLLIPVQLLRSLVVERAQMREQAIASVSRGWGGRQLISGPVLAIPATVNDTNVRELPRDWYVLPDSLELESQLTVEQERRKLGVYEVPVYKANVHAIAKFDVAPKLAALSAAQLGVTLHFDRARLLIPVSDTRGVREVKLADNSPSVGDFEPDRGFAMPAISAPIRAGAELQSGPRTFDLTVDVAGTESLQFMPFGRATKLKLAGNWAHPGFTRGFLPTERRISADRFDAQWQVLDLNRGYPGQWFQNEVQAPALSDSAFGVDLVQPVDLYVQAERSVKYAGLFIGLSLLTLFLWEFLTRKSLHPIQYALMGLALSVFYLLLLALAEHIGFTNAYVVAAIALCSLLGVYISGAFRSSKAGGGSALAFGSVYALLYLLVTSEDYALLAGSIGLFAILATVMLLTRRVNWYGTTSEPTPGETAL